MCFSGLYRSWQRLRGSSVLEGRPTRNSSFCCRCIQDRPPKAVLNGIQKRPPETTRTCSIFESLLGSLGHSLGLSWAAFGPILAHLELFLRLLGPLLAHLGLLLANLGPPLAHPRTLFDYLGPHVAFLNHFWGRWGTPWACLGQLLGLSWLILGSS